MVNDVSLRKQPGCLNPALVMCILAAVVAYMAGMNPALSTAVWSHPILPLSQGNQYIPALIHRWSSEFEVGKKKKEWGRGKERCLDPCGE